MYSGSVAVTSTGAAASAEAISASQSSHPGCSAAMEATVDAKPSLALTRTGVSGAPAMPRASATAGRYSIRRDGSMPPDAVTTAAGAASRMRAASSLGANPPKTTECTAPSRAVASIAITASGIIGM